MARQEIDLTTPQPNGKMGEPTKSAWEKVNDMTLELYDGVSVAANALPKAGGTMTGGIARTGVFGGENYRIQNQDSEVGIGGTYGTWNTNRTPALQVDAMNPNNAYMACRVSHWGVRHLWAVDVLEGGSSSSPVAVSFHFDTGISRHVFNSNGSATFLGTLTQNSDHRIKKETEEINEHLAGKSLRSVAPITFVDARFPEDGRRPGWVAHELQEAGLGVVVSGDKDATKVEDVTVGDTTPYAPGSEPEGYIPPHVEQRVVPLLQNVNYIGMGPYLHAGWLEHDKRIERLESEIVDLKSMISQLVGGSDADSI